MNSLRIVFHNVNHSPQQTHLVLEQCAAAEVDIVCLQEPWYGPIRPIPSASPAGPADRTEDNMLYGTQLHPAWRLIEARKDARVVCHGSRRLVNAFVTLDPAVDHRDCMLLAVRLDARHDPTNILNVYNDTRNSAVTYLTDIVQRLPDIDIAGGDYNTHSEVWDPAYPRRDSAERTGELLDLHATMGLRLLSPVGVQTHFPHHGASPTVIDLVWVPGDRDRGLYHIHVEGRDCGLSDHAIISVVIPTGEWSYKGQPTIAPKSEAEQEFISSIRDGLHAAFPLHPNLTSVDDLQLAVDTVFSCILNAWNAHARPATICTKTCQWWDASCTAARERLEAARNWLAQVRIDEPRLVPAARAAVKQAYRHVKSTVRARRRKHFDERIEQVASEQR
ncbi:Endonuclease/exonuclease/phosphatase, partial [Cubamyces lactineus]